MDGSNWQPSIRRRFTPHGILWSPDLVAAAVNVPADLYIAHYPTALPAAAVAAQRNGVIYAYDAEDFHLGDPPEGATHEVERKMIRAIEVHYLPGCAYVTAASCGIADAYVEAYGIKRPSIVLNVFPLAHAPATPTTKGTVSPGPSVYWFSQTIGPNRGWNAPCALLVEPPRNHIYIFVEHPPEALSIDCALSPLNPVSPIDLHFLPPAPPSEMERLAAVHDVGLVGETGHTPNRKIALTNKQFTYLLAGIPLVMSDIPAHRVFIPTWRSGATLPDG